MRVVGALVISLAVLVNSSDFSVFHRVREESPSGEVPGLPGFRFFVARTEDIPRVHVKLRGHPLVPILSPIRVIAKGNFIYAWEEDELIRLIFDSKGDVRVISTLTGWMEPMTLAHNAIVRPLVDLMRARTVALIREVDILKVHAAARLRSIDHLIQNKASRN